MGRRIRQPDIGYGRWLLSEAVRWLWVPAIGGAAGWAFAGPWVGLFAALALIVGISLALTILEFLV